MFPYNNVVIKERDYAEALKEEFDTEIQSEAFVFNRTIFISSSTCDYNYEDRNDISNG